MCGVSAGANCWFQECLSDSLKIKYGENQPLIIMKGLGFVKGLFVPHCDEPGRQENAKKLMEKTNLVAIQISNCAAIEIIDNKYRLITDKSVENNMEGYGIKSYWSNGKYFEEPIIKLNEFRKISELQK